MAQEPQSPPGVLERAQEDEGQRGEAHVARLAEDQRGRASQAEVVRGPRLRRLGRRLQLAWIWVGIRAGWVFARWRHPRHRLGRLVARWHLLAKREALTDPRLLYALLVVLLTAGWVNLAPDSADNRVLTQLTNYLVGAAIAGFVLLVWNDWIQSPIQARRLRRTIWRNPDVVLPFAPGETQQELIPRAELVERIPREDLYDEAILGVLPKDRRDVQVIVGEPGAGKTTALVGLAQRLARVGMVPVFVPLRANESADVTLDIVRLARERFEHHVRGRTRSDAELNTLWQWLYRRRRIAVLTDDVDQIGPDGEKGFVLRRTLESLASKDVPVIVTARPAGIPAGVAASAIALGELQEDDVVAQLTHASSKDPGARRGAQASETELRGWVREGHLTEVPFYLELLSSLDAVGRCPRLPEPDRWTSPQRSGRWVRKPGGEVEWNPHWVRFMLLQSYHAAVRDGHVHRWLGIERTERESSLESLERAALGVLGAISVEARMKADRKTPEQIAKKLPNRSIEHFLGSDDRVAFDEYYQRKRVSAHEVVDTGERLRLLDRKPDGSLQFRHRIMQAYLAGRALQQVALGKLASDWTFDQWVEKLLDDHHPEKLTAHMALLFTSLGCPAPVRGGSGNGDVPPADDPVERILRQLLARAALRLDPHGSNGSTSQDRAPRPIAMEGRREDPGNRTDPDDALLNLTTAAEIARAAERPGRGEPSAGPAGAEPFSRHRILELVGQAQGATRWTKLGAIRAIAALDGDESWYRIWDYICDPDYEVRRAASAELERHAERAYRALRGKIDRRLAKAATRSSLGHDLVRPESRDDPGRAAWRAAHPHAPETDVDGYSPDPYEWCQDEMQELTALGWILPAIVSGLREEPDEPVADGDRAGSERTAAVGLHPTEPAEPAAGGSNGGRGDRTDRERNALHVRRARHALDQLVHLALQRGQHDLQASLAQGFKGDAMRHADDPAGRFTGPGWVASNRRLVAGLCLVHAEFWYARMLLHQALALYAIAGADKTDTLNMYARLLRTPREPHPFAYRAACLARRAVARHGLGSGRWRNLIWTDEAEVTSRRTTVLDYKAAQLVADVTLLLNLNERSGEDRKAAFGYTEQLPHCLSTSPDRKEILGAGCPSSCGWEMCPYKQPPPDEPNAHRGVSRAFCRQQTRVASGFTTHRPPWQRRMGRRTLARFWREMERRART
ncbi:MAG TPA: ATP-binding protein [Thermoleophilaceae bacterium]|jgi:hypothetical protein